MANILVEMASKAGQAEIADAIRNFGSLENALRAETAAANAQAAATTSTSNKDTAVAAQQAAATSAQAAATSAQAAAQIVNVGVDPTLTVSGSAADAKTVGEIINDTIEHTFSDPIALSDNGWTDGYVNAAGGIQQASNYQYSPKIYVKKGDKIKATRTNVTIRFLAAYSGSDVVQSAGSNDPLTEYIVPDGVDSVIISINKSFPINYFKFYEYKYFVKELFDIKKKANSANLVAQMINARFSSKNLVEIDKITEGKYWDKNANVPSANASYFITDFIPVNEGEKIWISTSRFVCAFDVDKKNIPLQGISNDRGSRLEYTVPAGIAYVVISAMLVYKNSLMINRGTEHLPYKPYKIELEKQYIEDYLPNESQNLSVCYSLCGGNAVTATAENLNSDTFIYLDKFPKYLKKGVSMTFSGKFSNFVKVAIGKGYNKYRGTWIEIDNTNVYLKHCEDDNGDTTTIWKTEAHGLNINTFICLSLSVDSDNAALAHLSINTLNGSTTLTFDFAHEFNDTAFVFCSQTMTNVKFTAVANDIKCPMWLFGDSYFGVSGNRVIGQLINLGYAEGVLIDGRAGNNASHAYEDLEKLLALGGMPRYLVWCVGMNGTASDNINKLINLKGLQEQYGFELILQLVPTVPSRAANNNATNDAYAASGCRIIDAMQAVGSDVAGTWYSGYLDTDGVHPTMLGAKAIAARIVADAPEIMQFGFKQGNIAGGIRGDI